MIASEIEKKQTEANHVTTKKYQLSFTAGGLLYSESIRLAEEYAQTHDWEVVAQLAREQRLLQSRTTSTEHRKVREICSRLRLLTDAEQTVLHEGTRADQLQVLWLAVCKRYQFLHDFAEKVLRKQFLEMDYSLTVADIDRFMETTAVWQEELAEITSSTREKLKTVTLRMLREADLVTDEGVIQPALLSPALVRAIRADSEDHLLIFPISMADLGGNP